MERMSTYATAVKIVGFILYLVSCLLPFASNYAAASTAPPLLLSLDVEQDSDIESLELLDLNEPATYFITGAFARKYPDTVKHLATMGTVGSHSYAHLKMTEMSPEEIKQDLIESMLALEAATGRKPVWFRAPFLLYNEDLFQAAYELGFRFDSSMSGRWVDQRFLDEFPISINATGKILFSDYDIFSAYGFSNEMTLDLLKENYLQHTMTGRPFIFLLHPSIIAEYRDILHLFIFFVKQQGGRCLSFDQYLETFRAEENPTLAASFNPLEKLFDPERVADDLKVLGVTDLFISMTPFLGKNDSREQNSPPPPSLLKLIAALKAKKITIHGSLAPLDSLPPMVTKQHPMIDQSGNRSPNRLSPSAPATHGRLEQLISNLITDFEVDGIQLVDLAYPGIHFDFSSVALERFTRDTSISYNPNDLTSIVSDHYNEWVSWRVSQLDSIINTARAAIEKIDASVQLSAALRGRALTDYREMEESGQDFRILASNLDFITITNNKQGGYYSGPQITSGPLNRAQIGNRRFLLTLSPDDPDGLSKPRFEKLLEQSNYYTSTANGVVINDFQLIAAQDNSQNHSYENLLSTLKVPHNMSTQIGGDLSPPPPISPGGHRLGVETQSAQLIPAEQDTGSQNSLALIGGVSIIILGGGSLLLLQKHRNRSESKLSELEKTMLLGWREIEMTINSGTTNGPLVHSVARLLRSYDPVRVSKQRVYLILSVIKESDKKLTVNDLLATNIDVPGWEVLAMSHFKEALIHNFITLTEDRIVLTEKGKKEIASSGFRDFEPDQWIFFEKRLHEHLLVGCPHCSADNTAHWYWPSFTCSWCGREITFKRCSTPITVRSAGIELDHHRFH